jgi:hypothetical protein
MVDSLYKYYVGHCPLSELYMIYTTFGKLNPIPLSGIRRKGTYTDGSVRKS